MTNDPFPHRMPTWGDLLADGARALREGRGSARDDPRREAELLLREAVAADAAALVRGRDREATPVEAARFRDWVGARAQGIPLQHLLGRAEFHGVTLRCEPGVFIPRPETELLVETALEELKRRVESAGQSVPAVVLDLCTGTGAVAIAIAASVNSLTRVFAGEIDSAAVELARRNAAACGVAELVEVRESDLFEGFPDLEGRVDVLVSNPPYIDPARAETLPVEVRFGDPPRALFDPAGGTGFHRRIAREARRFLRAGAILALEIGDDQGRAVADILKGEGYEEIRIAPDLAGRDRIARGRWVPSTRFS